MERHASALKAARQALKRRARNVSVMSQCRTEMRKLKEMIATKSKGEDYKTKLNSQLNNIQSLLSRAASKNIMKRGTASRYVSRLSLGIQKALS